MCRRLFNNDSPLFFDLGLLRCRERSLRRLPHTLKESPRLLLTLDRSLQHGWLQRRAYSARKTCTYLVMQICFEPTFLTGNAVPSTQLRALTNRRMIPGAICHRSRESHDTPTFHLLRWLALRFHGPLDDAMAVLDARCLQTFANTVDCGA